MQLRLLNIPRREVGREVNGIFSSVGLDGREKTLKIAGREDVGRMMVRTAVYPFRSKTSV